MNILISVDIEGIIGTQAYRAITDETSRGYALACELMTREVNTAIAACKLGRCTHIYVADGHK